MNKSKKVNKKTWKNIKPHSRQSRKNMKLKHGSKCFLEPRRMKYPICNKYNGKPECQGLMAADYYLNINIGKLENTKKQNKSMKQKDRKQRNKKLDKYYKLKNKSNTIKRKLKCNLQNSNTI